MTIGEPELERIGEYVRKNLPVWMAEVPHPVLDRELDLRERAIRVEEQLSSQRELMESGFARMDKRFEQMDKRFSDLIHFTGNRFDDMHRHTNRWMTVLTVMLGLIGVAITVTNLL